MGCEDEEKLNQILVEVSRERCLLSGHNFRGGKACSPRVGFSVSLLLECHSKFRVVNTPNDE